MALEFIEFLDDTEVDTCPETESEHVLEFDNNVDSTTEEELTADPPIPPCRSKKECDVLFWGKVGAVAGMVGIVGWSVYDAWKSK